ncbi:hypothetical protein PHAVU_008G124400 [Phaseolus vulgaris]|uniref:F-box domain-containing protein n=1 Tax=Phaseolus vulgaris TaxID=3885 RepID=V7B3U7_PHAVU|nr:hypothetical protein PHAVU_008G124400g [Phaseolus vulgaris]ESW12572.1 hypothetical protein PHAVU_008G124400g [Phaseolus vulgaris]
METQDRISALPDEILCHILSFLSTNDSFATSLLSKRWQPLWLFLSIIDLDNQTFIQNGRSYTSFFKFAYGILLRCRMQQQLTIARFHLTPRVCGYSNDFPYHLFKKWVRIVIQRGIEQLYIEIPRALEVPHIIWSCKTLVILKLYRLSIDVFVKVHLPALKTLHLDFLFISKSQYLAEVLRGCPNLEDFRAYHIFLDNKLEGIEFQTMPKLVKADLKLDYVFEFPLKVVSNVEHLRFFLKLKKESFPMFENLIHLELHLESNIQWHLVIKMLNHCPKLETVILHMPAEPYSCTSWICPQFVPECIASKLKRCSIFNYTGRRSEMEFTKYIMQNSRALQTMAIRNTIIGKNYSSSRQNKRQMLQELVMCPKSSTNCKLFFK